MHRPDGLCCMRFSDARQRRGQAGGSFGKSLGNGVITETVISDDDKAHLPRLGPPIVVDPMICIVSSTSSRLMGHAPCRSWRR